MGIDVPLEARLQSEYLEPLFFATYLAVAEKLRALVAEFKQAPFPEGVGASNIDSRTCCFPIPRCRVSGLSPLLAPRESDAVLQSMFIIVSTTIRWVGEVVQPGKSCSL